MNSRPSGLTGYAELMELAGRARIPRNEKSILKALVQLANWKTGSGIRAKVKTIADIAGYKPRQTGILLDRLDARGLIVFVYKSKGGNSRPHIIDINVHQLRSLATEEGSGDDWDDVMPEPRIRRQPTAHSAAINRARNAHDQEETKKATNSPQPPEARTDAVRSTARQAGGGVEAALDEQERSARLLLRNGVRSSTLATAYSLRVIASAIKLVDDMPRPPKDRGAMIVHKLHTGEAQRYCEAAEVNAERARVREHMNQRASRVRLMQVRLRGYRGTPEASAIVESLRSVSSVWPNDDAVATGAPVSDKDLRLADTAPLKLLRILERAALKHRERHGVGHEAHRRVGVSTRGAS